MIKCDKCSKNEAAVKVEKNGTSKEIFNETFENGGDCWGYVGISAADPGHYCDSCFEIVEWEIEEISNV